jgi:hypothetical protein
VAGAGPHTDAGRRPIFVVAPPCGGARRVAALLASACRDSGRPLGGSARHALQVTELSSHFPQALFVYVHRDPADTLSEALAAWRNGPARRRPQPPGWKGPPWSFPLVPGWEQLSERPLPEIVVEQWLATMRELLAGLEALPADRWCITSFERLGADSESELQRLGGFLGIDLQPRQTGARAALAFAATGAVATELLPYLHRTHELAQRALAWIA